MGIGGYFLFFHGDTDSKKTSDVTDTSEEIDHETSEVKNETGSSINQSNVTLIAPPPPDIEARCSASNFPGSLSACLSACISSACCYPGFTGETCFGNPGCAPYTPYCDPFYDAWIGSTEGVLRNVTDEMAKKCTGVSNIIMDEKPSTPVSSPIGVSRLRGHVHNQNSRALQSTSAQTCANYCISAKCCSAPIINSPELSGLILSPTGVYTNASTGEYVVTNCQRSNAKNVQLCAQYESFCLTDDSPPDASTGQPFDYPSKLPLSSMPTSKPTVQETVPPTGFAPTNETILNVNSSSNPSQSPTISSFNNISPSPSSSSIATDLSVNASIAVPSAPIADIQKACTGNQVTFLITNGDLQARSMCANACKNGLCCFSSQLGFDMMESCYAGNEQACTEYASCLILRKEGSDSTSNETVLEVNDTAIDTATDVSNVPSDVTIVNYDNSTESLELPANDDNSTLATDGATTVEEDNAAEILGQSSDENNSTLPSDESLTNEGNNSTEALQQSDTNNINNPTLTNNNEGPPIPEADLSILCSEQFIAQTIGLNECLKACDLGRCCSTSDSTAECYSTHTEICFLYTPCNNAYSLIYSE